MPSSFNVLLLTLLHQARCLLLTHNTRSQTGPCSTSVTKTQDPLEGFPELGVEDCVDDRVEAGVQVAEKRGGLIELQGDEKRLKIHLKGEVAWRSVEAELDADGVEDVAREEWQPADQERGCEDFS